MKEKTVQLRRSLWLLLVLFSGVLPIMAQNYQVKGTVTDTNGELLPGVTVQLKGSSVGTATNVDGIYTINVPSGKQNVLTFSCVGYTPATVNVAEGQKVCDVTLTDSSNELNEVVVVAYGTQKKANLTGSVSSVNVKELQDIPASNTSRLLEGRMPGVTVSSFSAQPGNDDDVEIKVRGIGTFVNSSPLVLIDGVESSLSNVAVQDIESISVLKDAASAAIYGVRAANGVILVTTKQGEQDSKRVSYNASFGFQKATVLPTYLDSWQWAVLFNEENDALGGDAPLRNYTPEMIEALRNGSNPQLFANTNWMRELFRTAFVQRHHLSMSGGGDNSHYMASVGFTKQDGIMRGTSMKRATFRLNADSKFLNIFTLGLNTSGSYQDVAEPQSGTWEVFNQAVDHTRPTIPVKYDNGMWGQYDGNPQFPQYSTNPVEQTTFTGDERRYQFDGKLFLDVEPIRNLHIRTSFAYQYYNSEYEAFDPTHQHYKADGSMIPSGIASLNINGVNSQQWINENTVSYSITIADDHNLSALIGQSNQWNRNKYSRAVGENFLTNNVQVMDAAQNSSAYGNREEATLRSWFGRINYNYKGRYLFEANLRRDETSRIPKKNRTGYFPAVSAGWNVAEESFLRDQHTLNMLKLRASWGKLGNQDIGFYPYSQTYIIGSNNYIWGDKKVNGAALASAANPDIKWETTTTTDVGVDMTFLNKINLTFDFFNKTTSDILLQLPISALVGVEDAPYVNAAKVRNRGWELSLGYNDTFDKVTFGAKFNISRINNRIMDVADRTDWIDGWQINIAGSPIGAYYGYVADGLYTSQEQIDAVPVAFGTPRLGDIHYLDLNGDNQITDADRQVIGNPFPKLTYGLNLSAGYRGFDFSMFWQGIGKCDRVFMDYPAIGGGATENMWDRYNAENPAGTYPALGNEAYNALPSSFWVKSASYCRLKNLEIGYSIPTSVLSKAHIRNLRVYFSAENLFTITNVDNYDPEKYSSDSRNSTYPNAKTYSFGLNITL